MKMCFITTQVFLKLNFKKVYLFPLLFQGFDSEFLGHFFELFVRPLPFHAAHQATLCLAFSMK